MTSPSASPASSTPSSATEPAGGLGRWWPAALGGFAWAVTVLGATAVLTAGRRAAGVDPRTGEALLWQALAWTPWIPVAVLLSTVLRRCRNLKQMTGAVYGFALIVPVQTAWATALARAYSPAASGRPLPVLLLERLPVDLLVYTAIVGSVLAVAAQRRAAAQAATAAALARALELARAAPAPAAPERLAVSVGSRRVLVDPAEVEWFGSAGNYVVVNWAGREGLIRDTLAALEARLDPAVFARAHRSTLVNLSKVRETASLSDGSWRLLTESGAELVASRTHRDAILARLGR